MLKWYQFYGHEKKVPWTLKQPNANVNINDRLLE